MYKKHTYNCAHNNFVYTMANLRLNKNIRFFFQCLKEVLKFIKKV
ncbi:hypothetical protein HMPREF3232_00876 [Fannyhessea vaginae]|nr:hypothetical protein HMPREF3232_00876 [Fannyhessea vaginae]